MKMICLLRVDIIFLQLVTALTHTDDAKAMIMFYMKGSTPYLTTMIAK